LRYEHVLALALLHGSCIAKNRNMVWNECRQGNMSKRGFDHNYTKVAASATAI
jgi:hypothetical protein